MVIIEDCFQIDELITRATEQGMGDRTRANPQRIFPIFTQFVDQRAKIAVTGDDDKGLDLGARHRGFHGIERHANIGAIFAGPHAVDLDQIDGVIHQLFTIT